MLISVFDFTSLPFEFVYFYFYFCSYFYFFFFLNSCRLSHQQIRMQSTLFSFTAQWYFLSCFVLLNFALYLFLFFFSVSLFFFLFSYRYFFFHFSLSFSLSFSLLCSALLFSSLLFFYLLCALIGSRSDRRRVAIQSRENE